MNTTIKSNWDLIEGYDFLKEWDKNKSLRKDFCDHLRIESDKALIELRNKGSRKIY